MQNDKPNSRSTNTRDRALETLRQGTELGNHKA
jgi:hypothetical protein